MLRLAVPLVLLLAALPAAAFDVKAGRLRDDNEATITCPRICKNYGGWDKRWQKLPGGKSICRCVDGLLGNKDEANGGPVPTTSQSDWLCVRACEFYGGWNKTSRVIGDQLVCRCQQPLGSSRP